MKLTAKKVPYSSVVGQSVMLQDETGRVVCQLAILSPIGEGDYRTVSGKYADAVCEAFDDAAIHRILNMTDAEALAAVSPEELAEARRRLDAVTKT
jgi:hypothetical protein